MFLIVVLSKHYSSCFQGQLLTEIFNLLATILFYLITFTVAPRGQTGKSVRFIWSCRVYQQRKGEGSGPK